MVKESRCVNGHYIQPCINCGQMTCTECIVCREVKIAQLTVELADRDAILADALALLAPNPVADAAGPQGIREAVSDPGPNPGAALIAELEALRELEREYRRYCAEPSDVDDLREVDRALAALDKARGKP